MELTRNGNRSASALLLLACALVGAFGLASDTNAAKGGGRPGALDRSFGTGGKVTVVLPTEREFSTAVDYALPYEFAPGRATMATAGGGKVVVANGRAIVRFLANGRRDPGFGGAGAVPIGQIEGSFFRLAGIAVDSQNRILVAGTTKQKSRNGMIGPLVPGPIPSMATIRRYLPSGQLDPSFGSGGILNTHLGARPPTFEGTEYPEAAIAVVGLAVDAMDRPIVTGSAVAEVGHCPQSQNRFQDSQGIVVRLTVGGAPDTSFGGDGLRSIGGLSWLGTPTVTPAGLVLSGAKVEPCPKGNQPSPTFLVRLRDDGAVDADFGDGGFWSRPFTRVSDIATAPGGKLLLLTRTIELLGGDWYESNGAAARLRSDGSFDKSFGSGGCLGLKLRKLSFLEAIKADSKGRVLLLGDAWHRRKKGNGYWSSFLLIRRTVAGNADLQFGRRGRVTSGFGKRTRVSATNLLLGRGRIFAGGKVAGPRTGDNGFAVVRYLGGRR